LKVSNPEDGCSSRDPVSPASDGTMNFEIICSKSALELLELASIRPDVFGLIWLVQDRRREVLSLAVGIAANHSDPRRTAAEAFVDRSLAYVRNAEELLALCVGLDATDRGDLLGIALTRYSLDPRVLVTLLEDGVALGELAPGPLWCSDALWRRMNWLFQEYPGRTFSFDELVPAVVPAETRVRSVLGAALDEDRLSPEAVARVRSLFPNDSHIQMRTAR
jgi:hypothetical protein